MDPHLDSKSKTAHPAPCYPVEKQEAATMLRKIGRPRLLAAYMATPATITTGYMLWKAGEMGITIEPTLPWILSFTAFAAV